MANLIFCSDCGDSTGDLSEFSQSLNTSVQTGTVVTGSRALQMSLPNSAGAAYVTVSYVADAGRRISFYFRFSALPAVTARILNILPETSIELSTTGKLSIHSNATTTNGLTTLSANTWYRITFSYKVTSTAVNDFRVFLDNAASAEVSQTNVTLISTGSVDLLLGDDQFVTINSNFFYDNIYIDDGTTLDNPSTNGLFVTRKAPSASGTNNAFDTAIGSATNRWDYVSELPISTGKGWKQAGSSQVIEAYGIQGGSQGDVDITGATIIGWKAWLSGAGQDATTGVPQATATNSAKATGTTLALGAVTVAVGDVVVVLFGDQVVGTAPTIADNLGNTWTPLTGPNTNTARISKWYSAITVAGSMTATVTFQSSAGARAGALGVWDSSFIGILDKNIANANDSTSPYDCPLSGTLAQANEIVLGFCARASNAALVAGASETGIIEAHSSGSGGAGANVSVGLTYRLVTATTSIQPQMTGSSVAGVVGTASFKITPIVAGTPKLVDNGIDVAITLTSTQTFYSNHTTSASYPSNGNTIGMKSSGNAMDSFLYECGIQIVYSGPMPSPLIGTPEGHLGQSQMQQLLAQ
jgi:hypothetical protein